MPWLPAKYCCNWPPSPSEFSRLSGLTAVKVVSATGSPPAGRVVIETMPPVAPAP